MVEELLGSAPIVGKAGPVDPIESVTAAKIFGIYFSAHWCPPCRAFTPVLASVYEEANANGKVFEVIFASSDQSQAEFDGYYKTMPWLALPFGDERKKALSTKFAVSGIPRLVILKADGTVIDENARGAIQGNGPAAIEEYLSK